jgi:C4-type Zn-finger protein
MKTETVDHDDNIECPCCGKPLTLSRETTVDYFARPMEMK